MRFSDEGDFGVGPVPSEIAKIQQSTPLDKITVAGKDFLIFDPQ